MSTCISAPLYFISKILLTLVCSLFHNIIHTGEPARHIKIICATERVKNKLSLPLYFQPLQSLSNQSNTEITDNSVKYKFKLVGRFRLR